MFQKRLGEIFCDLVGLRGDARAYASADGVEVGALVR
jgi:hypothetical protein